MKIGYFGDGPWSHRALDRILENNEFQVPFIVGRCSQSDPYLKRYADRLRVPFYQPQSVNAPEFLDQIRAAAPDVLVSMSYDQILRHDILNVAPQGFINCHAGALPFYRGRNVLNWALINGESAFGITVHYVDEGIDTGDILVQRHVPIAPDDDYNDVLDKAFASCADVLYEALIQIAAGTAQRVRQNTIHPVGFYCSRRKEGDEWIDWNWPSERINNFVRALAHPGPCARTHYKDDVISLLKTELIPESPTYLGRPGEVVGRDSRGVIVKTGDRTLRVTQCKAPIGEVTPSWPVGTRLGLDPWEELRVAKARLTALEARLAVLESRTVVSE